jgi:two-component system chemotaxis response regulator CheV
MSASHEPRELMRDVDARTRLAGSNRMEILLFSLGSEETFGINVFKVREITDAMPLTLVPNLPAGIEGVVSLRGNVIPVLALARWFGLDTAGSNTMMVTEVSCHTQGFLVHEVDRIVRVEWDLVHAVGPSLAGSNNLVHAYTELPDGKLVSVLDIEQILADVFGQREVPALPQVAHPANVVFADDSQVARQRIVEVLDGIGARHQHATNGAEAWNLLQGLAASAQADGVLLRDKLDLVLTDAEMPEMDGYVLTQKIKADARFRGIPVVMHSSLSSEANRAMGRSVGVDAYVPKFDPAMLADTLRPLIENNAARKAGAQAI